MGREHCRKVASFCLKILSIEPNPLPDEHESPPVFAPYIRDCELAIRRPWVVPERRLLDFLLVYIQEGHCRFEVEGKEYPLGIGDFCLIQPGQRVTLEGLTNTITPYAHFDLIFNSHRASSFATRPGQLNLEAYQQFIQPQLESWGGHIPTVFRPEEVQMAGLAERWLRIVRLWNEGERWERLEAESQLGTLLLELLRHFRLPSSVPQAMPLSWIPSYLSMHLGEPITIETMSQRARLSPSRFHTLFRQTFGTTPGRYLAEMRVRHAAELLETTDWKLAHIAQLCGFADVHHFAKAFKKAMNATPGQYRSNF